MKNLTLIILALLWAASSLTFAQKNKGKQDTKAAEIKVPMSAEEWEYQAGKVEFITHKGIKAVKMDENSGNMLLKDFNFKNGTIEFDVEVNRAMPFPTIYFRWQDSNEAEHVYLRTGVAGKNNALDAVQYASIVNGVNLWDLQHEYQTAATLKINEWNHVKVVVSGKQLRVYINNPSEPNLEIPCMEGNTSEGKIGLGTGFPGQAIFANLVIRPDEVEGLPAQAAPDLTKHDTRYIRDWQVSVLDSLPYGKELNGFMLPKENTVWENISAERRGLVNLSRKFGNSKNRRVVWLRAKIKSDFAQRQTLKMGFSDEIWVFVNQKPTYVDKEIYYQNMRKSPNGRISLDNCQFDISLKQGENELLIGLANDFYGWGIIAQLEDIEGVEIIK